MEHLGTKVEELEPTLEQMLEKNRTGRRTSGYGLTDYEQQYLFSSDGLPSISLEKENLNTRIEELQPNLEQIVEECYPVTQRGIHEPGPVENKPQHAFSSDGFTFYFIKDAMENLNTRIEELEPDLEQIIRDCYPVPEREIREHGLFEIEQQLFLSDDLTLEDESPRMLKMMIVVLWLISLAMSRWDDETNIYWWKYFDMIWWTETITYIFLPVIAVNYGLTWAVRKLQGTFLYNVMQFAELVVERYCILIPIVVLSTVVGRNIALIWIVAQICLMVTVRWICREELIRMGWKDTPAWILAVLVHVSLMNHQALESVLIYTAVWTGIIVIVPVLLARYSLYSAPRIGVLLIAIFVNGFMRHIKRLSDCGPKMLKIVIIGLWLISIAMSRWKDGPNIRWGKYHDIIWWTDDPRINLWRQSPKNLYETIIYVFLPFMVVNYELSWIVWKLQEGNVYNVIHFAELIFERYCVLVPIMVISAVVGEDMALLRIVIQIVLMATSEWLCRKELTRHGHTDTLIWIIAIILHVTLRKYPEIILLIIDTLVWIGTIIHFSAMREGYTQYSALRIGLWLVAIAANGLVSDLNGLKISIQLFSFLVLVNYGITLMVYIISNFLGEEIGFQLMDFVELVGDSFGVLWPILVIVSSFGQIVEANDVVFIVFIITKILFTFVKNSKLNLSDSAILFVYLGWKMK